MYEQFTDRAKRVMQFANQEAQRFNHEYIGTEHILLGIVKDGNGVAANAIKNFGIDLRKIRPEVEKMLQYSPDMVLMGKLPQTPRSRKVIEYSMKEAQNLGCGYVGTGHILLGLLREQEGVAAQVLMHLGLKLDDVRKEVEDLTGKEFTCPKSATPPDDYFSDAARYAQLQKGLKKAAEVQPFTVAQAQALDVCRLCGSTTLEPGDALIYRFGEEYAHQSCLDRQSEELMATLTEIRNILVKANALANTSMQQLADAPNPEKCPQTPPAGDYDPALSAEPQIIKRA